MILYICYLYISFSGLFFAAERNGYEMSRLLIYGK